MRRMTKSSGMSLAEMMVATAILSVTSYTLSVLMSDFNKSTRGAQDVVVIQEKMAEIQFALSFDRYNADSNRVKSCRAALGLINTSNPFISGTTLSLSQITFPSDADPDPTLLATGQDLPGEVGLRVINISLEKINQGSLPTYSAHDDFPGSTRGLQILNPYTVYGAQLKIDFQSQRVESTFGAQVMTRTIPITLIYHSSNQLFYDCYIQESQDDKDCEGFFKGSTFDKKGAAGRSGAGPHCRVQNIASGSNTTLELQTGSSPQSRVVLTTNGNVGIGTTSPGNYRLYIQGDVIIEGDFENTANLQVNKELLISQASTISGITYASGSTPSIEVKADLNLKSNATIGSSSFASSSNALAAKTMTAEEGASLAGALSVGGSGSRSSQAWSSAKTTVSGNLIAGSINVTQSLKAEENIYATGRVISQGNTIAALPSDPGLQGGGCSQGFMTGITRDGKELGCGKPKLTGKECLPGQFIQNIDTTGSATCVSELDTSLKRLQCLTSEIPYWNSTGNFWECRSTNAKQGDYVLECSDVTPSTNEAGSMTCQNQKGSEYFCTSVVAFIGNNNNISSCDSSCSGPISDVDSNGVTYNVPCVSNYNKVRVRCCRIRTR